MVANCLRFTRLGEKDESPPSSPVSRERKSGRCSIVSIFFSYSLIEKKEGERRRNDSRDRFVRKRISLSLSLSYKDFTASTEAGSANSEKTWPLLAAVEITRILYARYTIVFQEIFYNHIHGFRPRDDIYCTAFLRYVSECAVASTRLSRYRTISFLGRRNNRPRPPPPLSNPFDW